MTNAAFTRIKKMYCYFNKSWFAKTLMLFFFALLPPSYIKYNTPKDMIGSSNYPHYASYSELKEIQGILKPYKGPGRSAKHSITDEMSGTEYVGTDIYIGFPNINSYDGKRVTARIYGNKIVEIEVEGVKKLSYQELINVANSARTAGIKFISISILLLFSVVFFLLWQTRDRES